ncbi:hypothetical protein CDL12_05627 [Handroanthus impetiginosus]|uniref:Late embryogenesis abundant protein LEA-2 subgroup domain-containing protein n=1 Tax=Handroanthus impetiginosus TaxID=429701 RepID=A0A2G9HVZ4_9LAMI|nr:hypothetical protein CDL12_05627 [Handroanthus impetiginosus]
MADKAKVQQSTHPLASPNTSPRSDTEATATACDGAARDHRKKTNRKKCLLYIPLFLLFQTGIILLLTLTVLKIKTPKFRIHSATLHNLAVKNTNFGRFKFENSYVNLFYRGMEVGRVLIPKGQSNWRSTKKFERKRSSDMNCSMDVLVSNREIKNIECK